MAHSLPHDAASPHVHVLQSFADTAFARDEVAFDDQARCRLGLFAEGRDRVDMEVDAGMLELISLYMVSQCHLLTQGMVTAIEAYTRSRRPDRMHLAQVILAIWRGGRPHRWCFRQFVFLAAMAMDQSVAVLKLCEDPVSADVRSPNTRRVDPAIHEALLIKDGHRGFSSVEAIGVSSGLRGRWAAHAQGETLMKYLFCGSTLLSLC